MLANVSLDDKYRLERGRVFLTGVQALARLPMLQRERDRAAGLNTAGYISGYRGSPLGGLDLALADAKEYLAAHDIKFQPGVNEDLAATAIWGSQQLHLFPDPKVDGIFAMWYGKGPGVDRSGDVFKHANYAGTARHGGVLLIAGDDHAARSSAVAHQSEHIFSACAIPVLTPAGLQDYLDLGLHGWAMSRYSGCWVAMKVTSDTVESSATVAIDAQRVQVRIPEDFVLPPDGVSIRWPDPQLVQERRMQEFKIYAALAYARANGLNHLVFDSPRPRLGIIACGKAYLDVRQALEDLGIDERLAAEIGLRLYKVGMAWPLEAEGVRRFAEGLEEILVVEEKRQIIEYQLKEQLYNWREDVRPRIVGKFDETGEWPAPHHAWLLPPTGELTPTLVARAIAARVGRFHSSEPMRQRMAFLEAKQKALAKPKLALMRTPYFCSGCPHNLSTRVPEGSAALGGVGCHLMAVGMGRNTLTISQMGGEGATWLGMAEHSGMQHVFANMGDGTYYHSGILAIRAAIAAGANITYKLLYNDAVAMTGGQPVDGPISVAQITHQVHSEGARRIIVMSDEPEKYGGSPGFAPGVEIRHRDALDRTQRELREVPGVTVIVYDQTCAAEKRRRRKKGAYPDPNVRVFINELVCDGCGDCSVKSNCLSVVPVDTEFGSKRMIDQFTCNKDYACVDGFCPSILTVHGGRLRRGAALEAGDAAFADMPEPALPSLEKPFSMLITGVGGTGVVTLGALLGMAAHLEGKGTTVLDMTGMAQKGGAVMTHVRFAARQEQLYSPRIATGEADALLGCDIVVAVGNEALSKVRSGHTRAVINTARTITGDFTRNPDYQFPADAMESQLVEALGASHGDFVDASRLAAVLLGHSIGTNMLLLGHAWQMGLVPVSQEALFRAIELNGVAIDDNKAAFLWGRRIAHDGAAVARLMREAEPVLPSHRKSESLDELIERRRGDLVKYQNEAYARRYDDLLARVRAAEQAVAPGSEALADAVARNYHKLLAYKDEYEVGRLYSDPEFERMIGGTFDGDYQIRFHLAIPLFSRIDANTGEPRKIAYGQWMRTAMRLLARFKFLRGTPFDPFGHSAERRMERALIAEYEETIGKLLAGLDADRIADAAEIARLPEKIRGFGHVKQRNVERSQAQRKELLSHYLQGTTQDKDAVAA